MTTQTPADASAQNATTEQSPMIRSSKEIGLLIGKAAAAGDIKNIRELATELQAANKREATAEVDARNQVIRERVNPLKEQFVRDITRSEGLVGFIREQGGVLSFSYTLAAEGSEQGPEVSIRVDAKAAPRAATTRTPSTNGTGGGRGKVYIVGGARLALSGAFDLVATADEVDAVEAAKLKGARPDAAVWAIKSRVVNKAAEAGRITIE